jgi:hypothetical protein
MLPARIGQFDTEPDPSFADRETYAVNLIGESLKTVAFIGIKQHGRFVPRATCFFVTQPEFGFNFLHLVTAEHVISGLLTKGYEIWLRVNVYGPKGAVEIPIPDASTIFKFHPDNENEATDVAVCPFSDRSTDEQTGEIIHAAIRSFRLDKEAQGFIPNEQFEKATIGLGAEVAIIGLFRSHYGTNQNVPVVRVGNISAMPGEPIFTKYAGHIKAYLIEARSISGLSGSPVLVVPDSAILLAAAMKGHVLMEQGCALLGLMHGHFDVRNLNEDVVTEEDAPERSVHTGMGVVVPLSKIIETVNHPDLIEMRKTTAKRLREEKGATADVVADDVPVSDANPRHLEDFTRLVDVAARKRPQGDQT